MRVNFEYGRRNTTKNNFANIRNAKGMKLGGFIIVTLCSKCEWNSELVWDSQRLSDTNEDEIQGRRLTQRLGQVAE